MQYTIYAANPARPYTGPLARPQELERFQTRAEALAALPEGAWLTAQWGPIAEATTNSIRAAAALYAAARA